MSEPRLAGRKPPAKITWRQARPDDPMFGKIFIVPIQRLVEEEPQNLREAEVCSHRATPLNQARSTVGAARSGAPDQA